MENKQREFGPEHAVFNLSKLGYRYFRLFINASDETITDLVNHFTAHPNVGWVYKAKGVFNLGIGIWAKNNNEINEVSTKIRNILGPDDEVVFQSELTSLYGFDYLSQDRKAFCVVDSTYENANLMPMEEEYIKLVAIDSTLSNAELAKMMNLAEEKVGAIKESLEKTGIIVNYKKRINFENIYYKVIIDTKSKTKVESFVKLEKLLWETPECIYVARANSKYDFEFEIVLKTEQELEKYLKYFTDYKISVLEQNLYTNLYPQNKIANFNIVKELLQKQFGKVIDLRNSKLWYLNHEGAKAYLNIYDNRKYFEEMNKDEVSLFPAIAEHLMQDSPHTIFNLVDIGSGNGMKGRMLIESLGDHNIKAYYPLDMQTIELEAALQVHKDGDYAKHPVYIDLENIESRFPIKTMPGEKNINAFFGGTYGNFDHKTINTHLKKIVNGQDYLLVTMAITAETKTDEEIIKSYMNDKVEDMAFGPLQQLGFSKSQFRRNQNHPEYVLHYQMDNRSATAYFILNQEVILDECTFKEGTVFRIMTSWKPKLKEFEEALEMEFKIEKIFVNGANAIMLIKNLKS